MAIGNNLSVSRTSGNLQYTYITTVEEEEGFWQHKQPIYIGKRHKTDRSISISISHCVTIDTL